MSRSHPLLPVLRVTTSLNCIYILVAPLLLRSCGRLVWQSHYQLNQLGAKKLYDPTLVSKVTTIARTKKKKEKVNALVAK